MSQEKMSLEYMSFKNKRRTILQLVSKLTPDMIFTSNYGGKK